MTSPALANENEEYIETTETVSTEITQQEARKLFVEHLSQVRANYGFEPADVVLHFVNDGPQCISDTNIVQNGNTDCPKVGEGNYHSTTEIVAGGSLDAAFDAWDQNSDHRGALFANNLGRVQVGVPTCQLLPNGDQGMVWAMRGGLNIDAANQPTRYNNTSMDLYTGDSVDVKSFPAITNVLCDGDKLISQTTRTVTTKNPDYKPEPTPAPKPAVERLADAYPKTRTDAKLGEIGRLYQASFNRLPDSSGLNSWTNAYKSGASLEAITREFGRSSEFKARYGGTMDAISADKFVTALYTNVLGRTPDAAGYSHWMSLIRNGTPREKILLGFSNSTESRIRTGTTSNSPSPELTSKPAEGTLGQVFPSTRTNADHGKVGRLYQASFNRLPDTPGFNYWTKAYSRGLSLDSMAYRFGAGPEFATRYGTTMSTISSDKFVTNLYANALGRTPDASGYNYWVGLLNNGKSRSSVLIGFAESDENKNRTGTNSPLGDIPSN